MGQLQVIEPLDVADVAEDAGTGANPDYVLTNDPKEVYAAAAVGQRKLRFDFGAVVDVAQVFLGYSNATDATAQAFQVDDMAGTGPVALGAAQPLRPADCVTERSSILLPVDFTGRYLQVTLGADSVVAHQLGRVVFGSAFTAEWGHEWGSGRQLIDTAKVTPLQGGGFGVEPGARKAAYSWTFGDLTDAETEALWAKVQRLGIGSPLVVNELSGAADHTVERLHYGLFKRIDQYERREPQATKWSLQIEEWI